MTKLKFLGAAALPGERQSLQVGAVLKIGEVTLMVGSG